MIPVPSADTSTLRQAAHLKKHLRRMDINRLFHCLLFASYLSPQRQVDKIGFCYRS